jgi:hypothetical protein
MDSCASRLSSWACFMLIAIRTFVFYACDVADQYLGRCAGNMRLKAIFCERLVVVPLGILASPPIFYSSSSYVWQEGFCVCTTPASRHMLSFERASLCPPAHCTVFDLLTGFIAVF